MHYYQHHIGDFIRDTANLTDSQCMAYLRLIWMYYDTEAPLQDSPRTLAFKLGSDAETIELLLEVFFKKDGDSWTHKRIDAEISAYHQKAQKARDSANARWANSGRNTDAMRSHSDGSASAERTQDFSSKVDANQEPITNNQEPENKKPPLPPKGEVVDSIAREFEEIWRIIPRRAGDTPSAALKAYRERRKQFGREEIRAGVDRYVAYCKAQRAADPSWDYQKGAKVFFGPDLHFQADWEVPRNLKLRRSDDDVFAGCI